MWEEIFKPLRIKRTTSIKHWVKINWPACLNLCHANTFLISFILFRSQSGTIKVYEPEIVCASQFCLIGSFNLAVIEEGVYACRHNYNMQMYLLLPEEGWCYVSPWIPEGVELLFSALLMASNGTDSELGLSIIIPECQPRVVEGSVQFTAWAG